MEEQQQGFINAPWKRKNWGYGGYISEKMFNVFFLSTKITIQGNHSNCSKEGHF